MIRIKAVARFVSALAVITLSTGAGAQGNVQQSSEVGKTVWANDGFMYRWSGRQWLKTADQRWFPNRYNAAEWDEYHNGILVQRVNIHERGWIAAYPYRDNPKQLWFKWPASGVTTENNLFFLFNGHWITLPQLKAWVAANQRTQQLSQPAPHSGRPTCADIAHEVQVAPCVRNMLPQSAFDQTEEESAYSNKVSSGIVTGMMMNQQRIYEDHTRDRLRQDEINDCLARKKTGFYDSRC